VKKALPAVMKFLGLISLTDMLSSPFGLALFPTC
jgi:hypothetical protein